VIVTPTVERAVAEPSRRSHFRQLGVNFSAHRAVDWILVTLAAAGAAAWFTHVEWSVTFWGFPLDDSWIHLQFARNLGTGQGFSYNPGIPVAGSTAPLWTILLAVPAWFGWDPIVSSKALGLVLTIVTALLAGQLTEWLTRSRGAGLFAALALALSPRMAWGSLSGMEVSLYAALVTGALLAYLRALETGSPWWGLLAGFAGFARPEAFIVFPVLALDWTVRTIRGLLPPPRLLRFALPMMLFAIPTASFVALNFHASGHPLPMTFYAKTYGMGTLPSLMEGRWHDAWVAAGWYPIEFLYQLLTWCESEYPDLALGALVGALALIGLTGDSASRRRGSYLLVAILIVAPLVKGLGAPEPPLLVHDGRYLFHLLVMFLIVSVIGVLELRRWLRGRWIVPLFLMAALLRLGLAIFDEAPEYAGMVKNINDLQIATARWIVKETSPEARIATNDIGAIAYFSRRFLIDTEGLVTPAAIHPKRMRRFAAFLESQRPDLLIIFPAWYPEIVARTDLFHEIYRIHAWQESAGGPSLVFYRMPWSRPEMVPNFLKK
jgi:arabinofuranosyltransferase